LDASAYSTRTSTSTNQPTSLINDPALDDGQQYYRPCNRTQPGWSAGHFGSPLFIWELVLDVTLAVVLVAFLNYQVIQLTLLIVMCH
jgi:hypothetical protein